MLSIVSLNNMSTLLWEQGQACKSRLVLHVLQQLLVGGERFNRTMLFGDNDMQGMMINTLFTQLPAPGAGAA